jgi:hypothetical protein
MSQGIAWHPLGMSAPISAESFEAFAEAAPGLAGQLAVPEQEVGSSKIRRADHRLGELVTPEYGGLPVPEH